MTDNFSPHLHLKKRFCYPDWHAIGEVITQKYPEQERKTAWQSVSHLWVTSIAESLGSDYHIHETPNFLVLSQAPPRVIRDAGKFFEDALKRIMMVLDGVASDEGGGKHVVFMFSKLKDYYDYIAHFYPDGEHPMNGGICLSGNGYVHYAFLTLDYSSYRTILVHELTHGCLAHLPIPAWLNEALAMRMDQVICQSDVFRLDQELFRKHRNHWDDETIQQFWSGESWTIPGDSFELSYNLALVLWRKIEVGFNAPHQAILEFVTLAHREDAGEQAFQTVFELSLGDLVTDFLGDGEWIPAPEHWPKEWLLNE